MTKRDNKAWYCWWKREDNKCYILGLVNRRGSCSLRRFEIGSGDQLRKLPNRSGDFQEAFADYLNPPCLSLHLSCQPNLAKDCKERLPEWVLCEIRNQITGFAISLSVSLLHK